MKKSIKCREPMLHPLGDGLVPCRKCEGCVNHTRMEWTNRMKLESYEKPLPLFITWTYNEDNYVNDVKAVKKDIQNLWKRLRKAEHEIRYFTVIERGSKKGRLHGHTLLWSSTLQSYTFTYLSMILRKTWNRGAIDIQKTRSAGAMNYVTKYLLKDIDYSTGELHTRNYSWSMKPMLGTAGLEYWERTVDHYHAQIPYSRDNPPPNKILIPIGGRAQPVYIPKRNWLDKAKQLGITFKISEYPELTDEELDLLITDGFPKKNKIT